mgnify:CR=1 FL=1
MLLFHQILLEVFRLMSVRNYLDACQLLLDFELAAKHTSNASTLLRSILLVLVLFVCICILYGSQESIPNSTDF